VGVEAAHAAAEAVEETVEEVLQFLEFAGFKEQDFEEVFDAGEG